MLCHLFHLKEQFKNTYVAVKRVGDAFWLAFLDCLEWSGMAFYSFLTTFYPKYQDNVVAKAEDIAEKVVKRIQRTFKYLVFKVFYSGVCVCHSRCISLGKKIGMAIDL